jgi:Holliday junction resolvase-like predicted endonuclease
VARDRVERLHEELIAHRKRSKFAEIDLLFKSSHGFTIVEVKSDNAVATLTPSQRRRLLRARASLEAATEKEVELVLALVRQLGPKAEIEYVELC